MRKLGIGAKSTVTAVFLVMFVIIAGTGIVKAGEAENKPQPSATTQATAPAANAEEIKKLIDQLGDKDFKIREKATNRIVEIGEPALPVLKGELEKRKADSEMLARLDFIINKITTKNDPEVEVEIAPKKGFFGSGGMSYQIVYLIDRSDSMIGSFEYLRKELKSSVEQLKTGQDFQVIFFPSDKFGDGNQSSSKPADIPAAVSDEVKKLITLLGDSDFKVRENASDSLAKMGEPAQRIMMERFKEKNLDLEIAGRLRILCKKTIALENLPKQLAPGNEQNRTAVSYYIEDVKAGGKTDPLPALKKAFEALNNDKECGKLIYILSDGKFPDSEAVLKLIKEQNKDRKIMICVFHYGEKTKESEEIMKKIASENKGRYKLVVPDKKDVPASQPK